MLVTGTWGKGGDGESDGANGGVRFEW
jgi:hypothetical protein